jgi:twitching motility protein PilT
MAWIDQLFHKMVEAGASDLHLSSNATPKFRLHGDIVDVPELEAIEPLQMAKYLAEIAPEDNAEQFNTEGDTDFAYEIEGLARFRANYFMDREGPGAVFRQIPSEILTAEQLGLPQAITDLCYLSKGLVLVTGPTGSGKSTTLAAMIDHINKTRSDHLITIEDPIEFVHRNQRCLINQREVHRHTQSFKRALRAALREDPDVILVGELRDLETIEIAIETAETGHLVFGTLHTTTAASTVDRLIDQFPADRQAQIRTMLAGSLKGVIAQTLCKKKEKGRAAALEVLIGNSAVAANIREGKTHQLTSVMQTGGKVGMRLLNDSLAELVQSGKVDPAEAYIKSVYKDDLMTKFEAAGIRFDRSQIGKNAAPQAPPAIPKAQPAPVPAPPVGARPPGPGAALPNTQPGAGQVQLNDSGTGGGGGGFADPFEQFKRNQGH